MQFTIYHVHDPMCSWCYAFKPTLDEIRKHLAKNIKFVHVVGGLAKDCDELMPKEQQEKIEAIWYQIENKVGTTFNHDFWKKCKPKRSTYKACRATLIAREYNKEDEMIEAIQNAYYKEAMNPSEVDVLIKLAKDIGLNENKFKEKLTSKEADELLEKDIKQRKKMNINSFPSLVLEYNKDFYPIDIKYNDPQSMLHQIKNLTANYYI